MPIVNPWGFANDERENVNNVDLNRNFDYNWRAGKGTDPTGKTIKVRFHLAKEKVKICIFS